MKVGRTVSKQIRHCLGGQWLRLDDRELCPSPWGTSADAEAGGGACCSEDGLDLSEGSSLGTPSGQYHPGMALNPVEEDMTGLIVAEQRVG